MSEESNNSRFFKVFSKRSSLDLAPDVQKSPDTKRSLCGRILWILVFILSSYICSILVWKSVSILSGDPIQITVDEQLSSIAEIPFPAMTICPQKKIKDNINLVTILEAYFKENITAAK
uniref:Uncharacterized protein n=1 Tax=Megaselia scalaris TaxID=36166 RepID=T1H5F7_MEGSC